jgi:hypothetical protein
MRRPPNESSAPNVACQNQMLAIDEEFLRRVDRVMLERKQADPFRREAAWRATEEEIRLRHLQLRDEDPDRSKSR